MSSTGLQNSFRFLRQGPDDKVNSTAASRQAGLNRTEPRCRGGRTMPRVFMHILNYIYIYTYVYIYIYTHITNIYTYNLNLSLCRLACLPACLPACLSVRVFCFGVVFEVVSLPPPIMTVSKLRGSPEQLPCVRSELSPSKGGTQALGRRGSAEMGQTRQTPSGLVV